MVLFPVNKYSERNHEVIREEVQYWKKKLSIGDIQRCVRMKYEEGSKE